MACNAVVTRRPCGRLMPDPDEPLHLKCELGGAPFVDVCRERVFIPGPPRRPMIWSASGGRRVIVRPICAGGWRVSLRPCRRSGQHDPTIHVTGTIPDPCAGSHRLSVLDANAPRAQGMYSSADMPPPSPPTTSTLPSGSSVAVWPWRGDTMEPVTLQVPLAGSYTSPLTG